MSSQPNVTRITMQIARQPCRRLIGSGCLPDRAGQPTQIVLHLDLDRLRGLPGGTSAARGPGPSGPPGR
jgi:hypothetical protein